MVGLPWGRHIRPYSHFRLVEFEAYGDYTLVSVRPLYKSSNLLTFTAIS